MHSLKYSIKGFALAALLSLVAVHTSCNVENSNQDNGPTGVVRAALVGVPSDVFCVRIEVQGARSTSQDFDVTPGVDTTLVVSGVSTGAVVVTVKGFTVGCASLTGSSVPNWISDPISAFVGTTGSTDVSADLHRNGQIRVGITFTDDATATCTDGIRNGMETNVDCGGGCKGCRHGEPCRVNTDCGSLFCDRGRCAPTCGNGVQDGTETGVDCGGDCGICDGQPCAPDPLQCASHQCTAGICTRNTATCMDGMRNGTESDVDCGGGGCPTCQPGQGCLAFDDCASRSCVQGLCAAPTCSDGIRNGGETDVDCGGPGAGACPPCGDGSCHDDKDCASNTCVSGRCRATCTDGVRDGTETDVDCGGDCNPCAEGLHCNVDTDCTILCVNGTCESKQCLPLGTGVTALFHANDTLDDSIAGLMGFSIGNLSFAPGMHGDGFLMDGVGSAVGVPTDPALDLANGFTIDAWINPTDAYGNGRIVDKIQPFGNDGYLVDLGGFHVRAIVGGEGLFTAAVVPQNVFTHIVVTFTPAGSLTIYINGRIAAAMPVVQTSVPTNVHPVLFGADQSGGSPFNGIIDEIRFWDHALDGKTVQLLYGQAKNCP